MKKELLKLTALLSAFMLNLTACSVPETTPEDSELISQVSETEIQYTEYTENTVPSETSEEISATEFTETATDYTSSEEEYTIANEETEIPENSEISENSEYSETDSEISEDFSIEDILYNMTLEEKICQMFIVTPEELTGYDCVTESDETVREAVEKMPVGGVIYFAKNLESAEQTTSMIEDIQNYALESGSGIGMFIAVDEEGGFVARVADELGETNTGAVAYMETPEEAYQAGADIAEYISKYGFNLDFAPVADVNINPENELGSRIFSDNPETVSLMSEAMVAGLQSTGKVSATLKHFPGLGAESGNTHYDSYTYIDRTPEELFSEEFNAFKGGIDAGTDFVMVGHQIMTCAGDNLPSDLSYTVVTEWLRNGLGFDGIIITDSHEMNTISGVYTSGESALMAITAGADMVLMSSDLENAVQTVSNAVYDGSLSETQIDSSVYRILSKKHKLGLI